MPNKKKKRLNAKLIINEDTSTGCLAHTVHDLAITAFLLCFSKEIAKLGAARVEAAQSWCAACD